MTKTDDTKFARLIRSVLPSRLPDENNPADRERLEKDKALVDRGFWPKMKRLAGKLPFAADLVAAWYCVRDPQTSFLVRATLMAALAYFVLPIDFVPDLLALVGFTDDAAVLVAAVKTLGGAITPEHQEKARAVLRGDVPMPEGPLPEEVPHEAPEVSEQVAEA